MNQESNPYEPPDPGRERGKTASVPRTIGSRIVSFFIYSVLCFGFIYIVGSGYYTNKLYRERPAGANYMTLGDMAAKEFRTKHPMVLFLLPIIIGGTRASMPR